MPGETDIARRNILHSHANPKPGRDYVISLEQQIILRFGADEAGSPIMIAIRYVPDREICDVSPMSHYFILLAQQRWSGVEEVAVTVIDDFNNELIPRWISVRISLQSNLTHTVYIEDRQPLWDNPAIVLRSQ